MKVALVVVVLVLAGCGGGGDKLQVYAASSLREVLPRLAPDAEFNFGGSNELATQILEGAPADVFVSADVDQAQRVRGLPGRIQPFATNRLVIVVARDADVDVRSIVDVTKRGLRLVLGDIGVPVGDYAREALDRAGVDALPNTVSYERDAKGVVAKVAVGDADAGIVYATDARAAGDGVVTVAIPSRLQPHIRYVAVVVDESGDRKAATRFLARLTGEQGRRELRRAGFGTP